MPATVKQCVVRVGEPAMRTVAGRSVLAWVLRELIRFGVTEFLLLTDHLPADVPASLPRPVRLTLSAAMAGSGTGGVLFAVREQLQSRFLLCDGNTLFDANIATLLAQAAADEPAADAPAMIGRLMSGCGIALYNSELLPHLQPACSLETDILPDLISRGVVQQVPQDHRFAAAADNQAAVAGRLRRKALFLDRDGVLNIDHGYVGASDRFEWVDGALDAIRHATNAGWHVFVVTNQSGVARGLFTETDVRVLLDWIADEARRTGGTIDDARYCPFHPDGTQDAYRQAHPWRKPMPGMLLDLIKAWDVDPLRSVMIGDQATDIAAASAAGMPGHLFAGGNLLDFLRPIVDQGVPDQPIVDQGVLDQPIVDQRA